MLLDKSSAAQTQWGPPLMTEESACSFKADAMALWGSLAGSMVLSFLPSLFFSSLLAPELQSHHRPGSSPPPSLKKVCCPLPSHYVPPAITLGRICFKHLFCPCCLSKASQWSFPPRGFVIVLWHLCLQFLLSSHYPHLFSDNKLKTRCTLCLKIDVI